MIKTSSYNIYLDIPNNRGEYLLIHGYTGAIDVVTEDIYKILKLSQNQPEELDKLSQENREVLSKRGYLTTKSKEEEIEVVQKVADKFYKVQSKYISITLVPTYNCNFRCTYCFEQKLFEKGADWLKQSMTVDMVDAVMNNVRDLRSQGKIVRDLWIFGGEPLLTKNYDIVKYIVEKSKENGLIVRCVTNGYELDRFIDLMGEDKIENIQVTIDGLKDTHDKRRYLVGKQPSFDKIVQNIDLLLNSNKKANIVIRSNIDETNVNEIGDIMSFFKEMGWADNPHFSAYFKSVHACYSTEKNPLDDTDVMKSIKENIPDAKRFGMESMYKTIAEKFMYLFKNKGYAPFKPAYCGAVMGGITVDPFGEIYPCWDVLGKESERIGRINEKQEIEYNERYEYWKNRIGCNIDECSKCAYVLFCGGGCPAHAQIANQDAYTSYCSEYKQIFNDVVPNVYKRYTDGI